MSSSAVSTEATPQSDSGFVKATVLIHSVSRQRLDLLIGMLDDTASMATRTGRRTSATMIC